MKEILETMINTLVSDQESVKINQIDGAQTTIFEVKVAEEDMGKVIGKQGVIAKAIRTIMKAVASKENKRVSVEFLD